MSVAPRVPLVVPGTRADLKATETFAPRLLSDELIDTRLTRIARQSDRIDPATFVQNVRWAPEPKAGVGASAGAQRR